MKVITMLMLFLGVGTSSQPVITESPKPPQSEVQIVQTIETAYKGNIKATRQDLSQYDDIIKAQFGSEFDLAKAVMIAESGADQEAVNYNCRYDVLKNGATTTISTSCKKNDRYNAWSVDCGLFQINQPDARICPQETFDPLWNIKKAKEMHSKRGWQPWSAYNNKSYLKYIDL